MSKIKVLSSKVYGRIAAGEVIASPYSVVKELVENSIDAGSTQIEIHIEKGGKQLIKVVDNGCGISREDLKTAFLPHATSKIVSLNDIETLTTLGFRGEGLTSISLVAMVELTSSTGDNSAYKIACNGGKIEDVVPAMLEKGTEIIVRNLFYNTPVRAKFLKEDRQEEADITAYVNKYILGNPSISFKYFVDGKLKLQSFGDGLEEALAQVYGAKAVAQCIKINAELNGIKISGFIGNQNFFKPNKSYQTTFLNGRYINSLPISTAIGNAYSPYTMKRQYPFYVLQINMPGSLFDVNVHPNKLDVRFLDSRLVFGTIYKTISSILDGKTEAAQFVVKESTSVPEIKSTFVERKPIPGAFGMTEPFTVQDQNLQKTTGEAPNFVAKENDGKLKYYNPFEREPISNFYNYNDENYTNVSSSEPVKFGEDENAIKEREQLKYEQQKIEFENFKYKGNLFNTYLIFEMCDTVYFIDQHAAHERLIYDSLKEKLINRKIETQGLLIPYLFATNPQETEFLEKNIKIIRNMGFDLKPFGAESFRVDEVPVDLQSINLEDFFSDLMSDINGLKDIKLEEILKDKIAMTACKHAVKGGMALTDEEIASLFKMLKGDMGLKCPHGRPVCVTMVKKDFEKMFKRIV